MQVVTRAQARERGATHYFTGVPCNHGHVARRYASNKRCVKCASAGHGDGLYTPRLKARAAGEQFYRGRACPSGHDGTRYATTGVCRTCASERAQARHSRLAHATPPWFSDHDRATIRRTYALARFMTEATGQAWEVDHIIPMNGKNVCGLHVAANIQAMPRRGNRRKGNKFSMWEAA